MGKEESGVEIIGRDVGEGEFPKDHGPIDPRWSPKGEKVPVVALIDVALRGGGFPKSKLAPENEDLAVLWLEGRRLNVVPAGGV